MNFGGTHSVHNGSCCKLGSQEADSEAEVRVQSVYLEVSPIGLRWLGLASFGH